jgi:hypothetical protein
MSNQIGRRRWITGIAQSLAASGAVRLLRAVDYDKPAPGSDKLTAEQSNGLILVRWNNRSLVTYRALASQKFPYVYPMAGPATGLSLLAESALPYPHHRGNWLGCQPLNEGDYWGDTPLEKGQIRTTKLQLGKTAPQSAVFTNECEWIRKDAPSPLEDKRTFTVTYADQQLWWLDADITVTAREDVTIKSAKHSFFALRVISQLSPLYGGILMNSEGGVGAEGTYAKPARWCGYHGKTYADVVEGLAVMDHPENPWAPCPWFTRDYGHFSPSPFAFLKQPWTLPKGKSIRMRYRVVLHAGTPQLAGLNALYKKWIG